MGNNIILPTSEPMSMFLENNTRNYLNNNALTGDAQTDTLNLIKFLNGCITSLYQNSKDEKIPLIKECPNVCIAMLIAARTDVALVTSGDRSCTNQQRYITDEERYELPVATYRSSGVNEGIWEIINSYTGAFGMLVEKYKSTATLNEKKEIFHLAKARLRIVYKCMIPYYVAVNNGIIDALNKKFYTFTPDLVFTSKIRTNYNPNIQNPVLQVAEDNSLWDVDGWFGSLGSPEFVGAILEVVQAACLPLAPRDKMVWFYSQTGNNGKGTLCQLIRNLLGKESTVSIPMADFSKRFGLANLPNAMAVITDENDVSSFNKGMGILKAVITGDEVTIEQKYQPSYNYSFNGLILQCVNDFPKGDDKTGSFYRRLHIIPFPNCFNGVQKRYIKANLIYRKDVLEYVLKKVLMDMPYRDKFTEYVGSEETLNVYKSYSNTVLDFLEEYIPIALWDLLPATDLLYEAYKGWYAKNVPAGKPIGRNDFINSAKQCIAELQSRDSNFEWEWTDSTRTQGHIDTTLREPLVLDFCVEPFYTLIGGHPMIGMKALKPKYSGLKRKKFVAGGVSDEGN